MNYKRKILIAVYLPEEWDVYVRRPHWMAIAKMVPVLAIEPPMGILTAFLHPRRLARYVKSRMRVHMGEAGILFFRPISLVSFGVSYRLSWLAKIDYILLSVQIKRVMRLLKSYYDYFISFIVKVQQYHVMNIIPDALICYEVTDEYRTTPMQDELNLDDPASIRAAEREQLILSQANCVFASSRNLHESRSKINPNTYYVSNCVDFDHFSKTLETCFEVPAELRSIPIPRLGYVGNINELIDFELINAIAKAKPRWSIVFVGSQNGSKKFVRDSAYQESESRVNVHFIGFKDYNLLPCYMKHFDVCLLPFRSNEWMRNSFPNKIYQYLAMGKPIVSTDFPAIYEVENVVYISKNKREYQQLIERALVEDNKERIKARMQVARCNTTHTRALRKIEILEMLL